MEVMEDGNLMDKVTILIQRDMEYYKSKQKILQENICSAIVGGHLDFPRYASFAAVKLVLWWEEEFIAAFRHNSGFMQHTSSAGEENQANSGACGGIVKSSDPAKFVGLITKSADQLLDHLHVLTQEALDHADLSVLTGTIGAAALLKNCVWCYIQYLQETNTVLTEQLRKSYKKYQEMGEALAERLLDLHCRLLSLYILQDADSLDWENSRPFCEMERGSYVVQMWWLYMQGTKEDLWNTVPPKMAQRVFSGMLNESLTILTVRYLHASPSENRNLLLTVDISNLLLCVANLLPAICDNAEQLLGFCLQSHSKILRDIHVKCQELLLCLIVRGSSLDILYKAFRKGIEDHPMFLSRGSNPSPWILLVFHNVFPEYPRNVRIFSDLSPSCAVTLEVMVLLAQPQPNWALLVQVLVMKNYKILNLVFSASMKALSEMQLTRAESFASKCNGFLCPKDGSCKTVDESPLLTQQQYYNIIVSVTHVFLCVGNPDELSQLYLPVIDKQPGWAHCFDRRQVWSQRRPPWYQAIVDLVSPLLPPIVKTVVSAVQTGASMYQAMSLVLACFSQLWDCVNPVLPRIAALIQDILPVDVIPLRHCPLLQVLISALYSELIKKCQSSDEKAVKLVDDQTTLQDENNANQMRDEKVDQNNVPPHKNPSLSLDGASNSTESIALAVAEALCSIDEDNKHTEQIDEFLDQVKKDVEIIETVNGCVALEQSSVRLEILASELLMTQHGKSSLKTLFHFIKHNKEWLYQSLGVSTDVVEYVPNKAYSRSIPLLHTMFHIDDRPFDQLLTGEWKLNWAELLNTPMGIDAERVWSQVGLRWEFQDGQTTGLSAQDAQLVANLTKVFKQAF